MKPIDHLKAAEHHLTEAYNKLNNRQGGRGELWKARQPPTLDEAKECLGQIADYEWLVRGKLGLQ